MITLVAAQALLNKYGFPCGAEDGVYGPKTRVALQHFQVATTSPVVASGGFDAATSDALLRLPKLSRHFTAPEMRSWDSCYIRAELLWALEDLRQNLGNPIPVASGYRSQAHNQAVGGASRSLHMWGLAADIFSVAVGASLDEVRELGLFSGIGWVASTGYVRHVDLRHLTGYHTATPWEPTVWSYPQ